MNENKVIGLKLQEINAEETQKIDYTFQPKKKKETLA